MLANTQAEIVTIGSTRCVKVTIGHVTEPWEIERTYDDIYKIFHGNPDNYKVIRKSNTDIIITT